MTALVDLQQRFPATLRPAALAAEAMVSASHPGSAQIISLDHRRGCLVGGSDSRQEGVALGA